MNETRPSVQQAVMRWRALLGEPHVDETAVAQARYGVCTTGAVRRIAAALRPAARTEIPAVLAIARECALPVYPVGTGRNWGYGTALPVTDDCAVLDLSRLNAIRAVDTELGLFEVEPGVTQAALAEYLRVHDLPFLVPTNGAGPDAGLLGNALERGYGITPTADHFAAVTRIEAVLPNGRLYTPALSALGAVNADHAFKWGLGPYIDGLFTQSNFGVVTAATLALARRPERIEAFYFAIPEAAALPAALRAVRGLLRELGSVCGSVNLMNRHRVLAMTAPHDPGRVDADGLLEADAVAELGRRHRIDPWMGMGALYGPAPLVAAARRLVRRRLAGIARRLVFLTGTRARWLHGASRRLLGPTHPMSDTLARIRASLEILEGRPNRVAHGLLYWRHPQGAPSELPSDPTAHGCGLIWYAPLVPFRTDPVLAYVERCTQVLRAHGMEPLITLSTLSDRCLDSSVPILFDVREPEQAERARRCYDALLAAGRELGVAPYRMPIDAMHKVTGSPQEYWNIVGQLKKSLDPDGIVAPGRYAPQ